MASICFQLGGGTEAPSLLGWGQQLCLRQHGFMLPGRASPAPTVRLISWPWQRQGQQTASPGCSAPSAAPARPKRGSPWAGTAWALLPSARHPFRWLRAAGCAPGRGWRGSGSFRLSWPGTVAALIWADSSCLQSTPALRGRCPSGGAPPFLPLQPPPTVTKGLLQQGVWARSAGEEG